MVLYTNGYKSASVFDHLFGKSPVFNRYSVLSFLAGSFIITVLPYIHIGIIHLKLWVPDKPPVSRKDCTCSCFDTVFKGSYENPGNVGYKHLYFNATWQTARMWIITVIFMLIAYESIKYIIRLVTKNKVRMSMLALFIINVYPHYYTWWNYVTYYNEDFYKYFNHHLLFSVTELIITSTVINLMDVETPLVSWQLLTIFSISLMHVILGGMDQFVAQLIDRNTKTFLKARDLALTIPDLLHIIISLWQLKNLKRGLSFRELFSKAEIIMCFIIVYMGTLIGRHL